MWIYVCVALGGIIAGFFLRMIQSSIYDILHSKTVGTLRVVKVGSGQEDLLLELEEPPSNLLDGQIITLDVTVTRR